MSQFYAGNIGVRVYLTHSDGQDRIEVYRTGGSNNPETGELLVKLEDTDASH